MTHQVLASVTNGEQVPSAEIFFLVKMRQELGLMSSEAGECQDTTVIKKRKRDLCP